MTARWLRHSGFALAGSSSGQARRVPKRVAPVRGRNEFLTLRRSQRRARSGPVAVHYVPAPPVDGVPRISYSVPRRVGTAVDRNRYRRRLRAVAYEVAPSLPPGAYLIGVEPDVRNVSFQELRSRVIEAMERASRGPAS